MSTLAPVLDLVGDIGHFSTFVYGGARWVLYLRETGALELHRSLDGITTWWSLDVPFPKEQVTACVLDNELCIAWAHRNTDEVHFSRWDLQTQVYSLAPTLLWAGVSPALARYGTSKLVLSYRDSLQRHVYRVSTDTGATWDVAPTIVDDENEVAEVDIDVFSGTQRVYWSETADPGI
jgi:hypothetical protein